MKKESEEDPFFSENPPRRNAWRGSALAVLLPPLGRGPALAEAGGANPAAGRESKRAARPYVDPQQLVSSVGRVFPVNTGGS